MAERVATPDRRVRRAVAAGAPSHSFRPPEIVLGVLLVAGSALGAVLWQRSVDRSVDVVVAAQPIQRGSVVDADDLGGVRLAGDTSGLITADEASALVGQVAVVDIAAGEPLTGALVAADRPLVPGEALASIALAPGEVPPDLARSDFVRVVVVDAGGPDADVSTLLDEVAEVWSVEPSTDGVLTVVTLRGSTDLFVAVARADRVHLARVASAR